MTNPYNNNINKINFYIKVLLNFIQKIKIINRNGSKYTFLMDTRAINFNFLHIFNLGLKTIHLKMSIFNELLIDKTSLVLK